MVTEGQDRAWADEILLPPHEIVVAAPTPAKDEFNVRVSPNPTAGPVSLYLEMETEQFVQVEIIDCAGRTVYADHSETRLPAGGHVLPLNLKEMTSGCTLYRRARKPEWMSKKSLKNNDVARLSKKVAENLLRLKTAPMFAP